MLASRNTYDKCLVRIQSLSLGHRCHHYFGFRLGNPICSSQYIHHIARLSGLDAACKAQRPSPKIGLPCPGGCSGTHGRDLALLHPHGFFLLTLSPLISLGLSLLHPLLCCFLYSLLLSRFVAPALWLPSGSFRPSQYRSSSPPPLGLSFLLSFPSFSARRPVAMGIQSDLRRFFPPWLRRISRILAVHITKVICAD